MATRVNFNVFRFGKTVKWNFIAPSSNFNRLIRASYVFNKWTPKVLLHFDINSLKAIFKISSMSPIIVFIGYRRIDRQLIIDGNFAGSAFHSKYAELDEEIFPPLPGFCSPKAWVKNRVYHHVPKSRFLRPFSNKYELVEKAFQTGSKKQFNAIFSQYDFDAALQGTLMHYYYIRSIFSTPFFDKFSLSCVSKKKILTKNMKKHLAQLFLQYDAPRHSAEVAPLRSALTRASSLKPVVPRIFGEGLTFVDSLLYVYSSIHKFYKLARKLASKVLYYRKLLETLKVLIPYNFHMAARCVRAGRRILKKTYVVRARKVRLLIPLIRAKAKRSRASFKSTIRVLKFWKERFFLKTPLSVLSNYLAVCREICQVPSALDLNNSFFFNGFFKPKNLKKIEFTKRRARVLMPDLLDSLKKVSAFKLLTRKYFTILYSTQRREKRFSARRSTGKKPGPIRALLAFLSLNKKMEAGERRKYVSFDIIRRSGYRMKYEYSFSYRRRVVKKINFFLLSLSRSLKKYFFLISPRGKNWFSGPLANNINKIREWYFKYKKLLKLINFSYFYSALFGRAVKGLSGLLSSANFYNVFIDISYFFNAIKSSPRNKVVAGVLKNSHPLYNFSPTSSEFSPFSASPNLNFIMSYSQRAFLNIVRRSDSSFFHDFNIVSNNAFNYLLTSDLIDVISKDGLSDESQLVNSFDFSFNRTRGMTNDYIPLVNRLTHRFKVRGFCDDIKEVLSVDFVREYDAKRKEMSDNDYKIALMYSNAPEFFVDRGFDQKDSVRLGVKELRFVVSSLYSNIKNIQIAIDDAFSGSFINTISSRKPFVPPYAIRGFDAALRLLRRLHSYVDRADKRIAAANAKLFLKTKKGSSAVYANFLIFNKLALFLMKYFAVWKNVVDTVSLDFTPDSGALYFPILDRKIIYFHDSHSSLFVKKNSLKSSFEFLTPYFEYFFNFFSFNSPRLTLNLSKIPMKVLPARIFYENFYSLLVHPNPSFFIFTKRLLSPIPAALKKKLPRRATVYYSVAKKSENALSGDLHAGPLNWHFEKTYSSAERKSVQDLASFYFKNRGYYDSTLLQSIKNSVNFLGLRPFRPMKFVVTVFPLVRDLFFRDFAPKITFFDNRIVPLDRVNKKKFFSTSRLSLSGEFKKFAVGDSAKRAVGRLSGNSFWALVLHILSNNNFDGVNKLFYLLKHDARGRVRNLSSRSKAPWLAPGSSPFTPEYQMVHTELLTNLNIAFYGIFRMPVFVKYFSFPFFFSATPALAKFASRTLNDLSSRGMPMNADTKDWYLEYVFICHACLVTRTVEGVVDFMTRILPYYKKWGDSVALILSPLASADFKELGISTIRVSLRGRPSGVERARSETHTFGPVREPALRKLYTTGSYYQKQCIVHDNGGVTNIHMWMLY